MSRHRSGADARQVPVLDAAPQPPHSSLPTSASASASRPLSSSSPSSSSSSSISPRPHPPAHDAMAATTTTSTAGAGKESVQEEDTDAELEATFRELRLYATQEALTAAAVALDRDGSEGGERERELAGATTTSSTAFRQSQQQQQPGSRIPDLSGLSGFNSDASPSSSATSAAAAAAAASTLDEHPGSTSPKRTKRVLSQMDVSELIQMKISQLESASTTEDDEEKAIAKALKKIHKEISQVLNGQEDHLAKVNFMQRKYLEMFQDMRKQERDHLKTKKKCELLQREKELLLREKERLQRSNDALLAERNRLQEERRSDKITVAKSNILCRKLENLCRQIHGDNRRIKVEVQQKTDQISGSFEKAIVEFKDKVEHDIAERQRVMDENDTLLRDKFQGFLEQYDVRERHFNSVVKSKDLELELAQAKLAQQRQVAEQEANKVGLLKSQLNAFSKTEAELRKQLNIYVEKFKQVEETLNKSNSLFQTFRREMEAMSKKGAGLEKVNQAIRAKCDTMNRNILEMAEERTKHQQALEEAHKKRAKLETLCRALHNERSVLRKSLDIYESRYPELARSAAATAAAAAAGTEDGERNDGASSTKKSSAGTLATGTASTAAPGAAPTAMAATDTIATIASPASPASPTITTTTSATTATASTTLPSSSLSVQHGGVKQGKVGGRRLSTTPSKLRQKQRQQHLHMMLQRREQGLQVGGLYAREGENEAAGEGLDPEMTGFGADSRESHEEGDEYADDDNDDEPPEEFAYPSD
ncbi:hypothetical protein BGZ99_009935 [Dissophora globulifera]|uniref:Alpha-taxilin n=1 Tax=Dissophora globulifera TaxID=979702 RepID=A0A9P6R375_9FUNG|nr:hypothetical protein BGZ99_009935 [Dissophora globulifera]